MRIVKVPKRKLFRTRLERLHACNLARKWVGKKSLRCAWNTCHRADWMLWFATMVGVPHRDLVQVACDCARAVMADIVCPKERAIAVQILSYAAEWVRSSNTSDTSSALRYLASFEVRNAQLPPWPRLGMQAAVHAALAIEEPWRLRGCAETAQFAVWPYSPLWEEDRIDEEIEVPFPLGHLVRKRISVETIIKKTGPLYCSSYMLEKEASEQPSSQEIDSILEEEGGHD